jgi:3-oxoacyl-[acyl-carrier-protein] synthase II
MSAHRTDRRRVVVTGFGAVTPLGLDVSTTWAGLLGGRSAIGHIRAFDASGFPVRIAAEVAAEEVEAHFRVPKLRKYADRKVMMAVRSAEEAMAHAGMGVGGFAPDPARFGVSVGTEAGRPLLQDIARRYYAFSDRVSAGGDLIEALRETDPLEFLRTMPHLSAALLGLLMDAQGPSYTCSTACTSSAQALGEATLAIRRGQADVMLAGGTDALVEAFMVTGFALLGALSQRNDEPSRASRPFDKDRDGFVLGEGAGFMVLEELEHARRRGAPILGELVGYGCSSNAYRITDSPPDGRGAAQSMVQAMRDGGLRPHDIGYINAHGTSTPMNDSSETRGIHKALGESAPSVPVSSTKSMMGHLVASCGVVESIVCLLALRDGVLPPTINYETPDPACDLDYVPNVAREVAGLRYTMTNSFGFGGSNGTLIFGHASLV